MAIFLSNYVFPTRYSLGATQTRLQSGTHETIHVKYNQVMLTSWTGLFNVHIGIKTDVHYSLLPDQNHVKRT